LLDSAAQWPDYDAGSRDVFQRVAGDVAAVAISMEGRVDVRPVLARRSILPI